MNRRALVRVISLSLMTAASCNLDGQVSVRLEIQPAVVTITRGGSAVVTVRSEVRGCDRKTLAFSVAQLSDDGAESPLPGGLVATFAEVEGGHALSLAALASAPGFARLRVNASGVCNGSAAIATAELDLHVAVPAFALRVEESNLEMTPGGGEIKVPVTVIPGPSYDDIEIQLGLSMSPEVEEFIETSWAPGPKVVGRKTVILHLRLREGFQPGDRPLLITVGANGAAGNIRRRIDLAIKALSPVVGFRIGQIRRLDDDGVQGSSRPTVRAVTTTRMGVPLDRAPGFTEAVALTIEHADPRLGAKLEVSRLEGPAQQAVLTVAPVAELPPGPYDVVVRGDAAGIVRRRVATVIVDESCTTAGYYARAAGIAGGALAFDLVTAGATLGFDVDVPAEHRGVSVGLSLEGENRRLTLRLPAGYAGESALVPVTVSYSNACDPRVESRTLVLSTLGGHQGGRWYASAGSIEKDGELTPQGGGPGTTHRALLKVQLQRTAGRGPARIALLRAEVSPPGLVVEGIGERHPLQDGHLDIPVRVPAGTRPGAYRATLIFAAEDETTDARTLEWTVQVEPKTLLELPLVRGATARRSGTSWTSESAPFVGPRTYGLQQKPVITFSGQPVGLSPTLSSNGIVTLSYGDALPPGVHQLLVSAAALPERLTRYAVLDVELLPPSDFSIAISTDPIVVRQGGSTSVNLSATRAGTSAAIDLVLEGAPSGLRLVGGRIPAGQSAASVTLAADGPETVTMPPVGVHEMTLVATLGAIAKRFPLTVTVAPGPDFTVTTNPPSIDVRRYSDATVAVVLGGDFPGNVTVVVDPHVCLDATLDEAGIALPVSANRTLRIHADRCQAAQAPYSLRLTATGAGGARVHPIDLPVLIRNPRGVSLFGGNALESAGTLRLRVELDGASERRIEVGYATSNGTAVADGLQVTRDYVSQRGSVRWEPGDATPKFIDVTLHDNAIDEDERFFTVSLFALEGTPLNAEILSARRSALGVIKDDDPEPVITLGTPAPVTEGSPSIVFPVTLVGATRRVVEVTAFTEDGTAAAGVDFLSAPQTITLGAGAPATTGFTVQLTPGDNVPEPTKAFVAKLRNPVNATLGSPASATGTILDDDSLPLVHVTAPPTVGEGAGIAIFQVALTAPSPQIVEVDYTTVDGTATSVTPADFAAQSGRLTWNPGDALVKTVNVVISDDGLVEGDETFKVSLSGAVRATIGTAEATTTIKDNDATATLEINSVNVPEGAGTAQVRISLSRPMPTPVSVGYQTSSLPPHTALPGPLVEGGDYGPAGGTVNFTPGGPTEMFISIPIHDDNRNENDETFAVNLVNPVGATVSTATGVVTIQDDDAPPSVSVANTSIGETAGSLVFTFTLSARSGRTVELDVRTEDETAMAPSDYLGFNNAKLTFAPGELSKQLLVGVLPDAVFEGDETMKIHIDSAQNASIQTPFAIGTIIDDDPEPVLRIAAVNPSVLESTPLGAVAFVVSVIGQTALPVSVHFETADGTAKDGEDYGSAQNELVFEPGATQQQIVHVSIIDDARYEGIETFQALLLQKSGASIDVGSATQTLVDDDPPPVVGVANSQAIESEGVMVFTIALGTVSARDVSVAYATSNGTATAGVDYTATTGRTTIPAGQLDATIGVPVIDNQIPDGERSFSFTLSAPLEAFLSPIKTTATGRIFDDEVASPGTFSIAAGSAPESAGALSFKVTLSRPMPGEVKVDYRTVNGSATSADDFDGTSDTLTFAPGETEKDIVVTLKDDAIIEPCERFQVQLENAAGAIVSNATATGTILDDDNFSETLWCGDKLPGRLAVATEGVYWQAEAGPLQAPNRGRVFRMPHDQGFLEPETLVTAPTTGQTGLGGIVVFFDSVYYAMDLPVVGHIGRQSRSGGVFTNPFVPALNRPTALAIDPDGIFVGENAPFASAPVKHFGLDATFLNVVTDPTNGTAGIVTVGTRVYTASAAGLQRTEKAGGLSLSLDPFIFPGGRIARDGTYVYYSLFDDTSADANVLRRVNIADDTLSNLLVQLPEIPVNIAVSGTRLAWSGNATVYLVDLIEGVIVDAYPTFAPVRDIAFTSDGLVWTEGSCAQTLPFDCEGELHKVVLGPEGEVVGG